MNQYREKMDEIRAPESLRAQTLQEIRLAQAEENKRQKQPMRIWKPLVGIAAAACLVLVIGFFGGMTNDKLVYHTVPAAVVRELPQDTQNNMTLEAYCDYLGVDISSPTGNAQLIKSEIRAEYADGVIREEESTFYYNVEGAPVMLRLSKTSAVAPESLQGREASEVADREVVAGISEDGTERMAAFECDGIHCFLLARQMERQDFERLLADVLEALNQASKK